MKKLITVVVVIAGLAGGYYKLSTTRLDFSFARVTRSNPKPAAK